MVEPVGGVGGVQDTLCVCMCVCTCVHACGVLEA